MTALASFFQNFFDNKARYFLGFIIVLSFFSCSSIKDSIDIGGETMGTTFSIKIVSQKNILLNPSQIRSGIDSILYSVNSQMSTYVPNSEISLFNSSPVNSAINISNEFSFVIARSIYWTNLSAGAFDITVLPLVLLWKEGKKDREYKDSWQPPTDLEITLEMIKVGSKKINLKKNTLKKSFAGQKLDVNAIAKGWGVDQIFNYIKELGYKNFMIEIGGEIRALGKNISNDYWMIGIDRPSTNTVPGQELFGIIPIKNQAMATSGNYRNFYEFNGKLYSHIVDPRTGRAIETNTSSVTVIGPKCVDADALATALSAMSLLQGKQLVEGLKDFEAIWIIRKENNFEIELSTGMPKLY